MIETERETAEGSPPLMVVRRPDIGETVAVAIDDREVRGGPEAKHNARTEDDARGQPRGSASHSR